MSGPVAPAPSAASKAKSKKRKAQDDSQPAGAKKQKASKHDEDEGLLDLEAGVNTAFVRMDPQLLADHVARQTKRFGTDLSSVELSDLYISANAVRDTTDFAKVRVKESLPDFLEEFAADPAEKDEKAVQKERRRLGEAPPKVGAPHTIIVAGAGLRAADLVRATRKFQKKGNVVSKLKPQFAKHFKVEEQVQFLKKGKTGIAVGTPARLEALIDNGEPFPLSQPHWRLADVIGRCSQYRVPKAYRGRCFPY
ncbi:hypothetical protein diail_6920 [Diaporthe ilicicola]|nr:hypothetical protein diail_6920 [Diaporthe ilicicola]